MSKQNVNFIIKLIFLWKEDPNVIDRELDNDNYKNYACLTDAWCEWHQQGKKITVSLVELRANADKIHKKTCSIPLEVEFFKL